MTLIELFAFASMFCNTQIPSAYDANVCAEHFYQHVHIEGADINECISEWSNR